MPGTRADLDGNNQLQTRYLHGEGAIVLERTIDVHIKTLRKKLGGKQDYIETVRGVGYRFRETAPQ